MGVQLVADDPSRIEEDGRSLLAARTVVAGVLAGALAVVGLTVIPSPEGPVFAAYGLTLLATAFNTKWVHLGLEKTGVVAVGRTAGEATLLVLVLLTVHGPSDLIQVPAAQVAGDSLTALILFLWLRRRGYRLPGPIDWSAARALASRAAPLVAGSLLSLLVYNADLIFLRFLRGIEAVGLYAAAYAIISFLANMSVAYGSSLLPTLSRLAEEPAAQEELYQTATAQTFAVALPIAVGGVLVAPGLIAVVFGPEYSASVLPLQILFATVLVSVFRSVGAAGLLAHGREDLILRMNGIATAANLCLNAALIPFYGMAGAAVATVITELCRATLARLYAAGEGHAPLVARRLWKPALAAVVMAGALLVGGWRAPWISIPAGAAAYALGLAVTGGLSLGRSRLPILDV